MWQFVFGWEASLYDQVFPEASDDWNGSVLSAMLIFGAAGAATVSCTCLLPYHSGVRTSGLVLPVSMAVACVGALAAVYWLRSGAAVLAVLVVVFFCWQLWNAGFFLVTA